MADETLSLVFSYLLLLQLSSYSNATTGVDAGEVDWKASHLPFFSRLTGLLEQFNWHFFPRVMLDIVYSQEENKFFVM